MTDPMTYPKCGHPKTPENTYLIETRYPRCKICAKDTSRQSHARVAAWRDPSANPYPDGHPDIALARAEKAKREAKKEPALNAARTAFLQQLDADKLARKGRGGRPRKSA